MCPVSNYTAKLNNQNSMVQAQKKKRHIDQKNREPINKPKHISSINL